MLSVKNLSAEAAAKYHEQDDAQIQDLPPELQAPLTSSWCGKGAQALGLQGAVEPDQFQQLLNGSDLEGNCLHAKPIDPNKHRAVTEFVFSSPKSASIALLVQKDYRIFAVDRQAVLTTLDVMESRWACARRWNSVARQQEKAHTGNLAIALFPHSTSRKLDPGFHTHADALNTTQAADTWRALWNDELINHLKLAGQIYQNECAYGLRCLGYEVIPRSNGCFELQGYSSALLKFFSKRRQDIEETAAQLDTPLSANTWEKIALHTRPRSQHVDLPTLFENWNQDIQRNGFILPHVPLGEEQDLNESGRTHAAIATSAAIEAVAQEEFTFKRERVEEQILLDSLGQQSWQHIQEAIAQSDQLICVDEAEQWYGTSKSLRQQQEAWQRVQQGRGVGAIATAAEVNQTESEYLVPARRSAFELAALCPDQFVIWQGIDPDERGYAELLYRRLVQEKGYIIRDVSTHEFSSTVLEQSQNQSEPGQEIWIVHESEKLSAKNLHNLLEQAENQQSRVLFLGDANRVPYLHAGNSFKWLQQIGVSTANVHETTPNHRTKRVPDHSQNTAFEQVEQLKTPVLNHLIKEPINASYKSRQTTSPHPADRTGIHLENDVAADAGAVTAKDEQLRAACHRLNRSTSNLASFVESASRPCRFSDSDLDTIARSITETAERRAINRLVQTIVGTVEGISGHIQESEASFRNLERHLRKPEPLNLETVLEKLAVAQVARLAKQLLQISGTGSSNTTKLVVDESLRCSIQQSGATLEINLPPREGQLAYNLRTQQHRTNLSEDKLAETAALLRQQIEVKGEENHRQHLLALVDLAVGLKLPPPPPGFLSQKQYNQVQKQETNWRQQLADRRQDLRDFKLELEGMKSTGPWQIGRNRMIAQKVEQQEQLEQDVTQLRENLSQATRVLQQAERAYQIEHQRQKDLYQSLAGQVEQRLPGLGQQETDRTIATLILFAAPPTAERELQINSLRFSTEAQKTNQTSDPGGASTQNYQDQIRKLAEQNLEWFRQQVERYQMEEKQRQREAQRKNQAPVLEQEVIREQPQTALLEDQQELAQTTISDHPKTPASQLLDQSQRLLKAIEQTYEQSQKEAGKPTRVPVGEWIASVHSNGDCTVRFQRKTLLQGNIQTGEVLTPLSEEAARTLQQMAHEHQLKQEQPLRNPTLANTRSQSPNMEI